MNDNPYREGEERIRRHKSMGKMFVAGFLLLVLGSGIQLLVRVVSPSILSDLMMASAGVKPSDIAQFHRMWTMVSALGSVISLTGVALLLFTIWKHHAVPAVVGTNET